MTELCHDYFLIDLKPSNHILTEENPDLTETLERDWLRVSADITSAFTIFFASRFWQISPENICIIQMW